MRAFVTTKSAGPSPRASATQANPKSDAAAAHMAGARTPNYSPPAGISCRPDGRAPRARSVRQPRQTEYSGAPTGNMRVWGVNLGGTQYARDPRTGHVG